MSTWKTPYHTYEELISEFEALGLIEFHLAHDSTQGKPILGFYLCNRPDLADRACLYTCIHSIEHPGPEMMLMLARWLVNHVDPLGNPITGADLAYANKIADNSFTVFVPVLNPDKFGTQPPYTLSKCNDSLGDIGSRSNANCVNLNRNFPHDWEPYTEQPGNQNPGCTLLTGGASAGSEKETKALMDGFFSGTYNAQFLGGKPNFVFDLHSGGAISNPMLYKPRVLSAEAQTFHNLIEAKIMALANSRMANMTMFETECNRGSTAVPKLVSAGSVGFTGMLITSAHHIGGAAAALVLEAFTRNNPVWSKVQTVCFEIILSAAMVFADTLPTPVTYPCPCCNFVFDSQAGLDDHKINVHEAECEGTFNWTTCVCTVTPPSYCCPCEPAVCFATQAELDAHKLTHANSCQTGYHWDWGTCVCVKDPGACFIATACGTNNLSLNSLRKFRDERLPLPLVHSYYHLSPPLAAFISSRNKLKFVGRRFFEGLANALYPKDEC